jgi:uncharacterized membrane protein
MQTRLGSLIEISINIATGFMTSMIVNYFLLPHFGCQMSVSDNFKMTVFFTVISIIRSYFVRRVFNKITHRKSNSVPQ